ncbi:hypothetical protein IAD21_00903 [Abditibacteriota bacterium]|nr:hypothetical protein IAD21_00903 [Abditibacteriota bacterium]
MKAPEQTPPVPTRIELGGLQSLLVYLFAAPLLVGIYGLAFCGLWGLVGRVARWMVAGY